MHVQVCSFLWLRSSLVWQKVIINITILFLTEFKSFWQFSVKLCVFLKYFHFHIFAIIHPNLDLLRSFLFYFEGQCVLLWTLWAIISEVAALFCSARWHRSMSVRLISAPPVLRVIPAVPKLPHRSAEITRCCVGRSSKLAIYRHYNRYPIYNIGSS
jgi:hypothetical protein